MTTSTKQHHQDQADGLGYCPECDHEYTEAQVGGLITGWVSEPTPCLSECPKCHTDRYRTLYWCKDLPLHRLTECEEFHEE